MRLRASPARIGCMNASGTTVRDASVSMGPGAMALVRMLSPPSSWASCWVIEFTPALARP